MSPRPSSIIRALSMSVLLTSTACDASDPAAETGEESGDTGEPQLFDCEAPADEASDPYLDCVVSITSPADSNYNHNLLPGVVLGPPGGNLDTASLGCGGELVVSFHDPVVVDGPGVDFVVFENPFTGFYEPARVSVSEDGIDWVDFDCDPVTLTGCAGAALVEAGPDSDIDPRDLDAAGGDHFDLGDIGVQRARYLRFTDVSREYWEPMGMDWCDPGQAGKGGFDLDAAVIINAEGA